MISFHGDHFRNDDEISVLGTTMGLLCDGSAEDEVEMISSSMIQCKFSSLIDDELLYFEVNGLRVDFEETEED